jgi:hypothetical protein
MGLAIWSVICLLFLCLSGGANAQLAEPKGASARDGRPADLFPPSRSDEEEQREGDIVRTTTSPLSICQLIASAAATNGLPFEFFARVIWQEGRFRSDAVGPVTRGGQRAQGIAQFMPVTAEERLLHDPFDPVEALPKSGEFLRELRQQFGNLGLAAAAYNAGPQRVRDWLAGKRTLPLETETYVRIVTGRPVQEWARPGQEALAVTIPSELTCTEATKVVSILPSGHTIAHPRPLSDWAVQLIGDRSEAKALSAYRQLQKKHEALLGIYEPVIVRTTLKVGAAPIWTRVRVDADSRQAAETLCSRLRAAGEVCLAQRN